MSRVRRPDRAGSVDTDGGLRAHLIGVVLVVAALVLMHASSAVAARSYVTQLTNANGTPFSIPFGLEVDGADNLWVSDTGSSSVSKFDSSGSFLAQNDGTGSWAGSTYVQDLAFGESAGLMYAVDSNIDDLWGLNLSDATYAGIDLNNGLGAGGSFLSGAVDNSGNAHDGDIYLASSLTVNAILRIDGSGNPSNFSASESYISGNQITGTPDHAFNTPWGIAVDAAGDVYVVDQVNNEVDRFDSTGTFVRAYTGSWGTLTALAIDPTTGNILVGDSTQSVVHEIDATSGASVGDIDGSTTPDGSFNPQGLAVDSHGTLYVADAAHPVVDVFDSGAVVLTHLLTVTNGGGGTVTSTPPGIDCGSTCSHSFNEGTLVTLTPTPAANHHFTGWSGACSGTGSCQVTMDADHSVTATFAIDTHAVNMTKAGTGSGTVTSSPVGIDCGSTCSHDYDHGAVVTLTATPAAGSSFTGWSGACTGTGTCQVTVTGVRNVTATFTANPTRALTVTTAGSGSVSSSPAGISCGADCSESYDQGTVVTLTATATAGSHFAGWSGACSGTGTCQVTMSAAASVTATFEADAAPTCATDPSLCPPTTTPGALKLDVAVAIVTDGKAAVKLSCKGDTACSDELKLTAKIKVKKGKRKVTKTVTLGKVSVEIAANGSETVKVRLNRTARKLLAKKPRLKAIIAGTVLKHAIVLKAKRR